MASNNLREFIKNNVLFAGEVAEILGVTKQHVNNLVNKGLLSPIKGGKAGNLFLKEDIEKYRDRNLLKNIVRPKEIVGSTTGDAVNYISKMENKDAIESISVYFDSDLAIRDGYYSWYEEFYNSYKENLVIPLQAPNCVIRFSDGEEIFINGINCGYGGEGPSGTHAVFIDLGIDIPEYIVETSSVIKVFKTDNGWEYYNKAKIEDDVLGLGKDFRRKLELKGKICKYNNNLVLIQNSGEKFERETRPEDFIRKYSYFIPEPVKVTFLSRKEALNTGHVTTVNFSETIYQIIITDISGRELWLDYFVDDTKSIKKQPALREIMEVLGDFKFTKDNSAHITTRMWNWLNNKVYIDDRREYTKC